MESRVCSSTSRRLSTIISTSSCTEDSWTHPPETAIISILGQKEQNFMPCAAKEYHGAGFNYGKDAAEDSGADEQLPLLAQMQVNVVQDHRQQNAARLWRQRARRRADQTYTSRFRAVVSPDTPESLSPGKKNRRLSTVRAMDCSLTTSMD